MAALVLDAGALIAGERGDRRFWVAFKRYQEDEEGATVIPATVITQVWRSPSQVKIARIINASLIEPIDLGVAQEAGLLCAATGTSDTVDAAVAVIAKRLRADVATSDPGDLKDLMDAAGATARILVM